MSKHYCTYCQNPVTSARIKCVECPDVDLCLQCFSCGAEIGSHRKEHDYRTLDDDSTPLFDSEENTWTYNEEVLLLDAVEQHGFGNWEDVSGHIEGKTGEECKDHYYAFYIHGNVGKSTFTEAGNGVKDHTTPEGGPLSPSLTTPLPPIELTLQEQQELGYMPFRDDFEREYDNESETIISGLSLNYDDEEIDITFKLVQVDMYRQRLKERQRRKRIARSYGLITNMCSTTVNNKKQQKDSQNKKKVNKDEKDFQEEMRVYAQFHTPVEHEQFFENLHKEKQIKSRIKELIRFRRNGISKLEECSHFEAERNRREKKKENKKKMAAAAASKRTSKKEKAEEGEEEDIVFVQGDKEDSAIKEMSGLPGYELLSERERRLCHSISMKPATYITIKTCIIKDYLQRRQGLPVKIRYPNHLDKTHRRKIMSFLSDNGWIGVV